MLCYSDFNILKRVLFKKKKMKKTFFKIVIVTNNCLSLKAASKQTIKSCIQHLIFGKRGQIRIERVEGTKTTRGNHLLARPHAETSL